MGRISCWRRRGTDSGVGLRGPVAAGDFKQHMDAQGMSFRKARVVEMVWLCAAKTQLLHDPLRAHIARHRERVNPRKLELGKTKLEGRPGSFRRESLAPQRREESPRNLDRGREVRIKLSAPQTNETTKGEHPWKLDDPRAKAVLFYVRHNPRKQRIAGRARQWTTQKLGYDWIGIESGKLFSIVVTEWPEQQSVGR